jgi:predicted dehydrogenase
VVEAVLGEIIEVDTRTDILWPTVKLTDSGEESLRETPDHVAVLGKTHSGAVLTADINGGVAPEDAHFSFEIRGSKGWLSLTSDHPYGFQAGGYVKAKTETERQLLHLRVGGTHSRARNAVASSTPRRIRFPAIAAEFDGDTHVDSESRPMVLESVREDDNKIVHVTMAVRVAKDEFDVWTEVFDNNW